MDAKPLAVVTPAFLPYGRQTISEADIAAVDAVLRSPFLTQGPAVPAFEQGLAHAVGASAVVAVNSATSALHLACLALGLGPGGLLWTTPITFVASANCGRYCGADVEFVDIDGDTGLICLQALECKLSNAAAAGRLPDLIVPVHLAGTSCAMADLAALVRPYGVKILEDASHAIGGHYRQEAVGSCRFSDAAVFSFHPVKIITSGEGGAVCCNDPELAERMRQLRSHGITKDPERFVQEAAGPWSYEQQMLGFNYRMTDLQAALGMSQLQRLGSVVTERNRLHRLYEDRLETLPVQLLAIPDDCLSALHLAVIQLDDDDAQRHRKVFEGMRAAGIGVQLHYSPVHLQPYYQQLGFNAGDFPAAEAYGRSAISLPLYPGLSELDLERVVTTLESVLKR
ncbi:UDP-4-amino-4,6-dideoxy-N-acetyl-beta-L-altrosamine transaminase [Synechococcus sp. HK01-R]|uniref:UDP-4-amino-4, 6-dideoxy-N-acetyl-beta-L-altrosamine transaminase n=1 Tax=Synechococcus sp. HK01-R TaxID=2751171 RepID=UPI002102264F|nr:UDP-4-amino-4,6-dideoxy-N-acetyl-beta-L-altrosamine transaminase [Synechococcus sp. HK01-R]